MALAFMLFTATACAQADAARKRFDIPSQPAAAALNEFARQADITLFFSYDLVAGVRTRALKGDYTVDDGLAQLLAGTGLGYQQAGDDAFLICRLSSCEPSHGTEGRGAAGQGADSDPEWRKTPSASSQ